MSVNCVSVSTAKKTAGLGVSYRAAKGEMFGTCPDSCPLKPYHTGTIEIDREYESAVRRAVPKLGISFLFTHFKPEQWAQKNQPGLAVFNYSADSLKETAHYIRRGVASVAVVASDFWKDKSSKGLTQFDGVKMVRCPEEYNGIGCRSCGGGEPLCARMDRKFGVVFTAHGSGKKKAADNDESGGCYANYHNVARHWRKLSKREQAESDSVRLTKFVKSLPPRSIFRAHIAGDIGKTPRT